MPKEWHLIEGCPFEEECMGEERAFKRKKMTFFGDSAADARCKCVHHLMYSSLHNKSKQVAWEATLEKETKILTEPWDEESEPPTAELPDDDDDERPSNNRPRRALANTADNEPDPLVADLSRQIFAMINANFGFSSVPHLGRPTVLAAKQHIADAENSARKAQDIAANAERAFEEVALELQRAHTRQQQVEQKRRALLF